MKIKTKLSLGVGFLFLLIILLIGVGVKYISQLSHDTQNILTANYNTIDYSREMLIALDEDMTTEKSKIKFQKNLERQMHNITEIGERELTVKLQGDFEKLVKNAEDKASFVEVRKDLTDIMLLNMQAIQRKSSIAAHTAQSAITAIALTGTVCFLLAFTLLLNLPGSIANPIKELTKSIKEIAAKNYSQRVNFESHNEYGELAKSFNSMAQKLEEYNNSSLAKLMIEKKRIETLINNMHDPVIGLDENLKIIFTNEVAIKIIGLSAETLIGKDARNIAMTNDLIRNLIKDLIMEEGSQTKEKESPVKIYADNKESYFEKETIHISIVPTGEQNKMLIGHVIILRNITSFKELDFAKTNFIATVSHEFRTPISSIKMSLQLLENEQVGQMNEEQKKLVESIKEDAGRLLKITAELLNMTQVESGNIQMNVVANNLKEILQYAVDATKIMAEQKRIIVAVNYPDIIPMINVDAEKTAWVLTNLIANAIRYSYEDSKILINIVAMNGHVEIAVKDAGQGIAPQYRDKIFDRYFRVPGTKEEGTGLGLAISKEFMEAQGGSIGLQSELGAGSTFTLVFNIANIEDK